MGAVILYSTKRRINLTLDGTAQTYRNYAMHNPDFRVYKGAQTVVEFFVRDTDRKPIALAGLELVATLVDHREARTLGEHTLELVDAARGLVRLTLEPKHVQALPLGFHSYTVGVRATSGALRMLYVDQHDQARGWFEIMQGALPEGKPSEVISGDAWHMQDAVFHSSAMPGNMQSGSYASLHSVAIYTTGFTGSLWVDASLVQDSPANSDWFTVKQFDLTRYSGITPLHFDTNAMWVRFRFKPSENNLGSLDQVLFRN